MASPWRTPRPATAAGRRSVFLFLGRECRILVRAHGSVAPGSSCPGGDSHSSPGRSRSGSLQESIAASLPDSRPLVFSRASRCVSTVGSSGRDRAGALISAASHDSHQNRRPWPISLVIAVLWTPSLPSARDAVAPPGAATLAPSLAAANTKSGKHQGLSRVLRRFTTLFAQFIFGGREVFVLI
jgi:hypothetical protein